MKTCIVNSSTGLVENVVEMGGVLPENAHQPSEPPEGLVWIEDDRAGIGWQLVNGVLVDPNAPAPVDPSVKRIAEIDTQMNASEQSKLLGRTVREDMVWRWVKDYVRDVMGKNPFALTGADDPLAVAALAALTNPNDPHYNSGFARLKAFDDTFVVLRAERTQLQQQLQPK